MGTIRVNVPINRVEGDLEVHLDVRDGVVADAWVKGIMFRGFERMLRGRAARDAIVLTPRICGLCSTSHHLTSVYALENAAGVTPPDAAVRLRNVALMAENLQNDIRHATLMFAPDLANPAYAHFSGHADAVRRYQVLRGSAAVATIRHSKKLLEIVAIIAGQWPHATFAVPGGNVGHPGSVAMFQCREILSEYRAWYEQAVLGCSLERWSEVASMADLDRWLDECPSHRDGDLGFLIRFGREIGLDRLGIGSTNFLSVGSLPLPAETGIMAEGGQFVSAGFVTGGHCSAFDGAKIAEHVAHSWFEESPGGLHPAFGETEPAPVGDEGVRYSWCKAPRYDGLPAETGPLAEQIVAGHPLYRDWVAQGGANPLVRMVARITRAATLMPAMVTWLDEGSESKLDQTFYKNPGPLVDGEGVGLTHAARGALGHWAKIRNGRIEAYQVITPTAWHGSPRDSASVRGPWEQALIGVPVPDLENPVAAGHVIRSFDPCMVCAVHTLSNGRPAGVMTLR
jgi:hydrogenase large subunit